MNYHFFLENAVRQFIDSSTVCDELVRARQQVQTWVGSMCWKQQDTYSYLVKTGPDKRQTRLGPRSPETDAIYTAFLENKKAAQARRGTLEQALQAAQRMNHALWVGRMPTLVGDELNALAEARLSAHFIVVGTHALYAYEITTGVRITPSALTTQAVDLLWDARKRVKSFTTME